jgi:hypothetical protein
MSSDHEAHFEAHFTPAMLHKGTAAAFKMSPFLRSRKVLTAVNLSDAVRGCDTYAKTKVVFGPMALGFVPCFHWFDLPILDNVAFRSTDSSAQLNGGKHQRPKAKSNWLPNDGANLLMKWAIHGGLRN